MLVLAIGDLHIPDRATGLPAKFRKLLSPGKIGQVLSLGNATDEPTEELLKSISPQYTAVRGEYDLNHSLPLNRVVTHGQLRIGIISGFSVIPNNDPDALLIAARQLDVDILLWGGSPSVEAYQLDGKFFISPGSATGAFSTDWTDSADPEIVPSFCLLDVQGSVCVIYVYSYKNDEVKVDKVSYRKQAPASHK